MEREVIPTFECDIMEIVESDSALEEQYTLPLVQTDENNCNLQTFQNQNTTVPKPAATVQRNICDEMVNNVEEVQGAASVWCGNKSIPGHDHAIPSSSASNRVVNIWDGSTSKSRATFIPVCEKTHQKTNYGSNHHQLEPTSKCKVQCFSLKTMLTPVLGNRMESSINMNTNENVLNECATNEGRTGMGGSQNEHNEEMNEAEKINQTEIIDAGQEMTMRESCKKERIGSLQIKIEERPVPWNMREKLIFDLSFMKKLFQITKVNVIFPQEIAIRSGVFEAVKRMVLKEMLADWLILKCEARQMPLSKVNNQVEIFSINNFQSLIRIITSESCLPIPFIYRRADSSDVTYFYLNFGTELNVKIPKLTLPIFYNVDNGKKKVSCKFPGIELDCSFEETVKRYTIHLHPSAMDIFRVNTSYIKESITYKHVIWGYLQLWVRGLAKKFKGHFRVQDIARNLCLLRESSGLECEDPDLYFIDYMNMYLKFDSGSLKQTVGFFTIDNFETNFVSDVSMIQFYRQYFLLNDEKYSNALKNVLLFGQNGKEIGTIHITQSNGGRGNKPETHKRLSVTCVNDAVESGDLIENSNSTAKTFVNQTLSDDETSVLFEGIQQTSTDGSVTDEPSRKDPAVDNSNSSEENLGETPGGSSLSSTKEVSRNQDPQTRLTKGSPRFTHGSSIEKRATKRSNQSRVPGGLHERFRKSADKASEEDFQSNSVNSANRKFKRARPNELEVAAFPQIFDSKATEGNVRNAHDASNVTRHGNSVIKPCSIVLDRSEVALYLERMNLKRRSSASMPIFVPRKKTCTMTSDEIKAEVLSSEDEEKSSEEESMPGKSKIRKEFDRDRDRRELKVEVTRLEDVLEPGHYSRNRIEDETEASTENMNELIRMCGRKIKDCFEVKDGKIYLKEGYEVENGEIVPAKRKGGVKKKYF